VRFAESLPVLRTGVTVALRCFLREIIEKQFMEIHVTESLSFTVSLSNLCHSFLDDTYCSFVGTSLRKNEYIHLNLMKCVHVEY
jgi:hypothetical protein